jgi:hypothetical protein
MTRLLRTYIQLQTYLELKAKYLLTGSKNFLGQTYSREMQYMIYAHQLLP